MPIQGGLGQGGVGRANLPNIDQIHTMDPWDPRREYLTIQECPHYLKRLFGIKSKHTSIRRWINKGTVRRGGKGDTDRLYLKAFRFGNLRLVRKKDLLAFLMHPGT